MKRLLWVPALALLVLALAACGEAAAPPAPPSASSASSSSASPASAASSSAPSAASASASAAGAPSATASSPSSTSAAAPASTAAKASTSATSGGPRIFTIVPQESRATYHVRERFFDRPTSSVAEGSTSDIKGSVTLDPRQPAQVRFEGLTVNLRTLTSDESRRDNALRTRTLDTSKYPLAEYNSVKVESAPASYQPGQEAAFKISGLMKIRDTEKPLTFDVKVKLDGNDLTGLATTEFKMTDFNIQPPSLTILKAEEGVQLDVEFTARATS